MLESQLRGTSSFLSVVQTFQVQQEDDDAQLTVWMKWIMTLPMLTLLTPRELMIGLGRMHAYVALFYLLLEVWISPIFFLFLEVLEHL